MIFLPDLSDGETSDNMANVDEEDDDEVVLNSNPGFNRYLFCSIAKENLI